MLFQKKRNFSADHCLCVEGTWLANNSDLLFMSVYSPQDLSHKRALWAYMTGIINRWHEHDFTSVVKDSWNDDGIISPNAMIMLKNLKQRLKTWSNEKRNINDHDPKVKWAIEGDENSKFFHGIVNKKLRHLDIKGILVDGEWIDDLIRVKSEFYNHFKNIFSAPEWDRVPFEGHFTRRLNEDQSSDLEGD
nr:RNA-directed DNA polymerase, eukaryota [Tanacetum cinerariifolium]